MIQVLGAPGIIVGTNLVQVCLSLRVVVQQACLGGRRSADDVLKVSLRVALDLRLCEPVAGPRDEDSRVDDDFAQAFETRLEPGEDVLGWPDVGRQVLREVVFVELRRGLRTIESGVDVECAVCVVRALEGVYLAVLESLLAERPARQVFGLYILDFGYFSVSDVYSACGVLQSYPTLARASCQGKRHKTTFDASSEQTQLAHP